MHIGQSLLCDHARRATGPLAEVINQLFELRVWHVRTVERVQEIIQEASHPVDTMAASCDNGSMRWKNVG